MDHSHPEPPSRPTETKQIAQECGATLLMQTELDRVTAAGSKPGATSEGKSALQSILFAR